MTSPHTLRAGLCMVGMVGIETITALVQGPQAFYNAAASLTGEPNCSVQDPGPKLLAVGGGQRNRPMRNHRLEVIARMNRSRHGMTHSGPTHPARTDHAASLLGIPVGDPTV